MVDIWSNLLEESSVCWAPVFRHINIISIQLSISQWQWQRSYILVRMSSFVNICFRWWSLYLSYDAVTQQWWNLVRPPLSVNSLYLHLLLSAVIIIIVIHLNLTSFVTIAVIHPHDRHCCDLNHFPPLSNSDHQVTIPPLFSTELWSSSTSH